jgi:tetratricopeptide (TPR) repeat protein
LNVVLSLAPEPAEIEEPLLVGNEARAEAAPSSEAGAVVTDPALAQPLVEEEDAVALRPTDGAEPPIFPLPEPAVPADTPGSGTEAQRGVMPPARGVDRLVQWFSPRMLGLMAPGLALLFLALIVSARSFSVAGAIFPDWGLASLRIGIVAAILGVILLLFYLMAWQAKVRPAPIYGGLVGLLLLSIGAAGVLSASPLHRLQGRWFEERGEYGLALAAYQASGDSLAQSQDMARIAVEWAEQLSAQHDYQDAVAQLEPVVRLYRGETALAVRARQDLIGGYLAWGDQARQQGAFRAALAHYQALQRAAYCNANCQTQAHTGIALALLGLAQQLAANKQYNEAVATYQQIVQSYGDTPAAQEADLALTAPQMLTGHLVYADKTPAAHFLVLLASQWSFNSSTQVFTLQGQQYRAQTDAAGFFAVPSVAVGRTYMIAWIDTGGHGGTCLTANNQPLYTVQMQPLRATDAGSMNIECI